MTTTMPPREPTRAATNNDACVRVIGVHKQFDSGYGRHHALKGVDLDIVEGEFLTVLGPSGCGKTTLLRILAGFEDPSSGEVWLDGRPITHLPPNKRPMAMVFQSYALFPHLSVFDNIAYGLKIAKVPKAEIRERVDVVLTITNLVGLGGRLPTQLSGGQQQRVALARSVVIRPRVLLFDEPLSNLDARLRDQMRSELRRIQRQLGVTSVYVTHDQSEAMAMSDRIVVMNDGAIEQVGTPAEIYRRPRTLFVADFIGHANVLPVKVLSDLGDTVEVDLLGVEVRVDRAEPGGSDDLAVILRPEHVEVSPSGERTQAGNETRPDDLHFPGWIQAVEFLGASSQLSVELVDGTLVTAVRHHPAGAVEPGHNFAAGQEVMIHIAPSALLAVARA